MEPCPGPCPLSLSMDNTYYDGVLYMVTLLTFDSLFFVTELNTQSIYRSQRRIINLQGASEETLLSIE